MPERDDTMSAAEVFTFSSRLVGIWVSGCSADGILCTLADEGVVQAGRERRVRATSSGILYEFFVFCISFHLPVMLVLLAEDLKRRLQLHTQNGV